MNKITIILIITLFCSCVNNAKTSISKIKMGVPEQVACITEKVSNVSYIQLDSSAGIFNIDKMLISNDTIFILDHFQTNTLKAFNMNGEYLYQVGFRGRGNSEYLEIRNFTVDNSYIYMVDNVKRKLFVHNKSDGSFVKSKDMPIVADDIALLSDNRLLFYIPKPIKGTILNQKQSKSQLFIVDSMLNIIDEFMEYDELTYNQTSQFSAFTTSGDRILLSTQASNLFSVIPKDMANKSEIQQIQLVVDGEDDFVEGLDYADIMKYKTVVPPVYMIGDNLLGTMYVPESIPSSFIYDMRDSITYYNNKIDLSNQNFAANYVMPISCISNHTIYSVLSSLERYKSLIDYGFEKAADKDVAVLENGGILIVEYLLCD